MLQKYYVYIFLTNKMIDLKLKIKILNGLGVYISKTINNNPKLILDKLTKSIINKNHLNNVGITHGGYIASLIDSGAGTAAHRAADNSPCVTISLELKFMTTSKEGDEIIGFVKILKKTKTMVFLICHLKSKEKIVASASGIWKIIKKKSLNLNLEG